MTSRRVIVLVLVMLFCHASAKTEPGAGALALPVRGPSRCGVKSLSSLPSGNAWGASRLGSFFFTAESWGNEFMLSGELGAGLVYECPGFGFVFGGLPFEIDRVHAASLGGFDRGALLLTLPLLHVCALRMFAACDFVSQSSSVSQAASCNVSMAQGFPWCLRAVSPESAERREETLGAGCVSDAALPNSPRLRRAWYEQYMLTFIRSHLRHSAEHWAEAATFCEVSATCILGGPFSWRRNLRILCVSHRASAPTRRAEACIGLALGLTTWSGTTIAQKCLGVSQRPRGVPVNINQSNH